MYSPKHLHDLCILLAILLEGKLTLLVVVLVLSTSSVLSSLSLVLGHICGLVLVLLVCGVDLEMSSRRERGRVGF